MIEGEQMKDRIMERHWEGYRASCISERGNCHAASEQIRKEKEAFFAGTAMMYRELMGLCDPRASKMSKSDIEKLDSISMEVKQFCEKLLVRAGERFLA